MLMNGCTIKLTENFIFCNEVHYRKWTSCFHTQTYVFKYTTVHDKSEKANVTVKCDTVFSVW